MNWKETLCRAVGAMASTGWRGEAVVRLLTPLLAAAKPRSEIALQNYEIAFPEASEAQRRQWLRESYEHLIRMGVECLVLQKDVRQVFNWFVEYEGLEHLQQAAADGRGAILVACHAGNWELGGGWIAQKAWAPLTVIVRHSQNVKEKAAVDRLRANLGIQTISKDAPMIGVVRKLKRGEFVAILADQHGGPEGLMVPHWGLVTSTSPGPAAFAMMTGVPLIPMIAIRIAPFRYRIVVKQPIHWTSGQSREATIRGITHKINRAIEQMVALAPGQWLCQHRRFREHYR